jgi:secreted trypsin-like serine protease
MKKIFVLPFVLSMLGLLSACTDASSSQPTSNNMVCGIVGGQNVQTPSDLASHLVLLLMKTDRGTKGCTGTLLSPDVVLTAAHCVDRVLDDPNARMKIIFSDDPQCATQRGQTSVLRFVESVRVHQSWFQSDHQRGDLALVKMTQAAPQGYSPLPLAKGFAELSSNQAVTVVGYGITTVDYHSKDKAPIALRKTTVYPINSSLKQVLVESEHKKDPNSTLRVQDLRNSDDQENLIFDQSHGHGICAGDSGGPALLGSGKQMRIIGVASAVENPLNHEAECGLFGVHTNTVRYNSWVDETLHDLEQ